MDKPNSFDLTTLGEAAIYLVVGALIMCVSGGIAYAGMHCSWVVAVPLFILSATTGVIGAVAYCLGMAAAFIGLRALSKTGG